MNKIKDEISLVSKVEQITMMDLRRSPGDIIDAVELGKAFVITKAGKQIAVLSRLPGETLTEVIDKYGHSKYVSSNAKE